MFKKIFFITILITLFAIPLLFINATQPVMITLNQHEFKPGDEIKAKVIFTNNNSKQLRGRLFCNFVSLDNELPPMPYVEEIDLDPGQKSKEFIFTMTVGETMPEGLYRADVEVKDEHNNLIIKSNKQFLVTGTKKNINANLLICQDVNCENNKAVFIKGETVYLKLKTNITKLQIDAQIKNSKTQEQQTIVFVSHVAQIEAEQEGSFAINLTLNKDGCIEQKIKKNFAVIDAPAQIKSASVCNIDGKCIVPENEQNCPQDCVKGNQATDNNFKTVILIIAILIIIAIAIIIYYLIRKKKQEKY